MGHPCVDYDNLAVWALDDLDYYGDGYCWRCDGRDSYWEVRADEYVAVGMVEVADVGRHLNFDSYLHCD